MNHEPECADKKYQFADMYGATACQCAAVRAAYQRGREDATKQHLPHQQHLLHVSKRPLADMTREERMLENIRRIWSIGWVAWIEEHDAEVYERGREDAAEAVAVLEPTQDYGFLRLWRDEAIVAARGEVRGNEFLFTPRVDEAKKHGRADNLIRTSNPPQYLCICGEFHTISAARGDGEKA